MRKVKYALAGTPDQIKREIDSLQKIGGNGALSGSAGSSTRASCPGRMSARSSSSPST
jgi:hypothetical protein